jgi:hypothetical protein
MDNADSQADLSAASRPSRLPMPAIILPGDSLGHTLSQSN